MTIRRPSPSPEIVEYLSRQPERKPMRQRAIADIRSDVSDWARSVGGTPQPVAAVEDIDADGVPARLYRPTGDEDAVLTWLHGGAWMLGDLDHGDAIVRALANRVGCAVLSVDYRLAPEHRYPAAVDDAWTATLWSAQAFSKVAVGGDSAGGNLAAAVALRARDADVRIALQLLVYPLVECAVESASYFRFGRLYSEFAGHEGFGTAAHDDHRFMWEIYVPDLADRLRPDAAPMRAASLAGVAPATIITAEHDIVRHDAWEYARWLRAETVPVWVQDYPGQIHGFFHMLGVTDDACRAVDDAASSLRQAFGDLS